MSDFYTFKISFDKIEVNTIDGCFRGFFTWSELFQHGYLGF